MDMESQNMNITTATQCSPCISRTPIAPLPCPLLFAGVVSPSQLLIILISAFLSFSSDVISRCSPQATATPTARPNDRLAGLNLINGKADNDLIFWRAGALDRRT